MDYDALEKHILLKLDNELDKRLTYHCTAHTVDVIEATRRLAVLEHVNGTNLTIVKTAALLHDVGMTRSYINHEEASTEIAEEILPKYNYSEENITQVNKIILTTKIPQGAKTLQEQILCDADLDYLGRPDFHMISLRLKYEWDELGIKPTTLRQWYMIQAEFLSRHNYYTESARRLRQKIKESHLEQIKEMCSINNYTP